MADKPDLYRITPNKIPLKKLYVWVSVDQRGNEGIMSKQLGLEHFPCVTSTEHVALGMTEMMQDILGWKSSWQRSSGPKTS